MTHINHQKSGGEVHSGRLPNQKIIIKLSYTSQYTCQSKISVFSQVIGSQQSQEQSGGNYCTKFLTVIKTISNINFTLSFGTIEFVLPYSLTFLNQ